VLARIARVGDGWLPGYRTAAEAQASLDTLAGYAEQHGRSLAELGMEPRLHLRHGRETLPKTVEGWCAAGATHVAFNTMAAGLRTPQAHLDALENFAREHGVAI